jgi:outer membrane protein OmpA-like peptidoglycan-associated protein
MRGLVALVFVVVLAGCEGQQIRGREAGALTGGALGAGLGAIVGNQSGNSGEGALIGAAAGALAGGLLGNQVDNTNAALDDRDKKLSERERQLQENRRLIDELRRGGADVRSTDRGVVVNLPDILFEFDRARLTSDARRNVGEIGSVITAQASGRRVAVEGHTDNIGTVSYNQRLSEERVQSVVNALSERGVSRRTIVTRGYGESQPIASNRTSEGRARNRRVEVVIENR